MGNRMMALKRNMTSCSLLVCQLVSPIPQRLFELWQRWPRQRRIQRKGGCLLHHLNETFEALETFPLPRDVHSAKKLSPKEENSHRASPRLIFHAYYTTLLRYIRCNGSVSKIPPFRTHVEGIKSTTHNPLVQLQPCFGYLPVALLSPSCRGRVCSDMWFINRPLSTLQSQSLILWLLLASALWLGSSSLHLNDNTLSFPFWIHETCVYICSYSSIKMGQRAWP
ncbi:hypothetical protein V8C34DRAFT_102942 [Trichoderma compactum]